MEYVNAFWVGGLICVVGQILIDKTKLTPARILVAFVSLGTVLSLLGLYEPLVKFAGAGATVPITGFGYSLFKGTTEALSQYGVIGIWKGGLAAVSTGLSAAILFGFAAALIFKPKMK